MKIAIFVEIKSLKKYLFALIVSSYVITVVGIPVYFHYCGGELEEINYVLKGNGCCGDDEAHSTGDIPDCCEDENVILVSKSDFTTKDLSVYAFIRNVSELACVQLPFLDPVFLSPEPFSYKAPAPFMEQHSLIISTSVLRI
jgi:hypothetical protein